MVYEIEFKCQGFEYEYEIDASTGAVLKHEKDTEKGLLSYLAAAPCVYVLTTQVFL